MPSDLYSDRCLFLAKPGVSREQGNASAEANTLAPRPPPHSFPTLCGRAPAQHHPPRPCGGRIAGDIGVDPGPAGLGSLSRRGVAGTAYTEGNFYLRDINDERDLAIPFWRAPRVACLVTAPCTPLKILRRGSAVVSFLMGRAVVAWTGWLAALDLGLEQAARLRLNSTPPPRYTTPCGWLRRDCVTTTRGSVLPRVGHGWPERGWCGLARCGGVRPI